MMEKGKKETTRTALKCTYPVNLQGGRRTRFLYVIWFEMNFQGTPRHQFWDPLLWIQQQQNLPGRNLFKEDFQQVTIKANKQV